MRLEVKYKLFHRVGESYVPNKYDSYTIIDIDYTEDENELYNFVKTELARTIGRSTTEFKIIGYVEV